MTAEELKELEKTCKKLNVFRILAAPVFAFILLIRINFRLKLVRRLSAC